MEIDQKQKLQYLILKIAKEVVRICNKYNIEYYLDGGTMLGAIRHRGFIPWDDDLDIAMKRSEYERFLIICEKELDKSIFFLQTEHSERNYCFAFAKLQLLDTRIIEEFSEYVNIKHGIFVDIFPYDNLPDSFIQKKYLLFTNHILKTLLWIKCGYGTLEHKRKLSYKILKVLSIPFSITFLKKQRYDLVTQNNTSNTKQCFASDYPKCILENDWFKESALYEFETEKFCGFKQYDAFLTNLYGEYMKLPLPKDRIQHSYYRIDFGVYEE